jgi:uracil-DNA glycosylase family 4
MTTQQEQLDTLAQEIMDSNICPELAAQASQLVLGSGDPNADILFIGEAPGKKEDSTGEPFVGASGKFLDEMLSSVGIKRKDVYITNIVKYRPPNNRDPSSQEKKEFWPYLLKQIAIIRPKLIATLGKHSGTALIPSLIIKTDHGIAQKIKMLLNGIEEQITIVPLYHPAAALYNGGLRQTLLEDFQAVPHIIKENS